MFREEKNLKDSKKDSIKDTSSSVPAPYQTLSLSSESAISYTKTNKLITALYMVTDIMDKDEPLRNKLRTLGTEIISDPEGKSTSYGASMSIMRIEQIMSFLDIAVAVNIISEMNYSILKKEFLELGQSIKESAGNIGTANRHINLTEFFKEELSSTKKDLTGGGKRKNSIGHAFPTRIGVQKGSTLLKALSNVGHPTTNRNGPAPYEAEGFRSGFDILKKQRRNDIINIIKTIGGNVTIKDIKDKIQNSSAGTGTLVSFGEKTLQRELISMVKDNVLNRVGEKRWSRYGLVSGN